VRASGTLTGAGPSAAAPRVPLARRLQFAIARPNYRWRFPRDAGAHPAYANEWWYFTGNLRAPSGHRFGFELTFFRISPRPGAALAQDLFFAHFAVTDISARHFYFHARARRGAWNQAGVRGSPPLVWNVNWRARFGAGGPRALRARWGQFGIDLQLRPGRRMFNGPDGYSRKGPAPGEASEYYSIPRIAARGTLAVRGRRYAVSGLVWMDHEFATDQLAPGQIGWDWMGLQLTAAPNAALTGTGPSAAPPRVPLVSGAGPSAAAPRDLMLFRLRDRNGRPDLFSAGTLRAADGDSTLTLAQFHMTPGRIWRSPKTGGRYPVVWRVEIPGRELSLEITADLDDQELRTRVPMPVDYWEGAVRVRGQWRGRTIRGRGYLEMTGYSQPLTAFHAHGGSPRANHAGKKRRIEREGREIPQGGPLPASDARAGRAQRSGAPTEAASRAAAGERAERTR
ncbi:MAG: lipocalin-like domain-containing protein, partial [Terriglobales bacterium]